ncbi:alpha/beta fold hydrolase [Dactylosporangium vinaceum]|uniref:Alpha/beta fold hydrolase n=1 Tax=Dactylosporangium vinaceum TaxID=53362 RepID=A0ABV5MDD2_9ACTN|nr:alpha/beta fold hydrolase [Dactylosporangium vinaceum]UAC01189.1 alpha/beta fold hydrolase [Dactylosporangium vinaceum]
MALRLARMSRAERRAAVAAPHPFLGFVSHNVCAGRLRLHVREHLTPGAPAWVLLHGLAVSHRYLMPTAAALAPASVHVPDLPGFGLSDKPREIYGPRRHAEVVAAWMDRAGIGPAGVLGNSFGCQVAVELAIVRPDLVSALVLVGPTVDPAAASAAGQIGRWLRDLAREDPWQARILAADLRDAGPRRVLGTLRRCVEHRMDERLPLVGTVPTLLLRGERDPIAPRRWLERAAARTPNAMVGEVPLAGHNAVTTAGAAVAALAQSSGTSCRAASSALAPPPAEPAS